MRITDEMVQQAIDYQRQVAEIGDGFTEGMGFEEMVVRRLLHEVAPDPLVKCLRSRVALLATLPVEDNPLAQSDPPLPFVTEAHSCPSCDTSERVPARIVDLLRRSGVEDGDLLIAWVEQAAFATTGPRRGATSVRP